MLDLDTRSSETSSRLLDSPIGALKIFVRDGDLIHLQIESEQDATSNAQRVAELGSNSEHRVVDTATLNLAEQQLREYFAGKRRIFELPVKLIGTDFQRRVWQQLAELPFGATSSYGQLAAAIGSPQAARPVGGAVGANPLPIIIGCHRILSASQALTGYSGGAGLATKRWLLQHEGIAWRN